MASEQQVCCQQQNDLDRRNRNQYACDKQTRADQHFRKRMAAAFVLFFLLGRDDLDLALDIRADFADFGQQRVRIVTLYAELLGLINQYAVIDTVQLADLVLHFGGTVCAAEVFERVNALTVLAVVLGLGCDDLGFTLNAGADFADFRQERIRIFAGYAQLLGLKYENAVLHALEFADALLHFCRAVCAADILQRVNALDAVRAGGVLVMVMLVFVLVVMMMMAAAAAAVIVMMMVVLMFILIVMVMVTAAAVIVIVVMVVMLVFLILVVMVMVTAAAVAVIVMMMVVLVLLILIVVVMVTAAAIVVIVMMMVVLALLVLIVVMRMPAAAVAFIFIVLVMMMFVLMHFFI